MQGMFDWDGDQARVKPWLREDISWEIADVGDQDAVRGLGEHDLVVASNFLCHMDDASAARCMRNLVGLTRSRADMSSSRVWIWTSAHRSRASLDGSPGGVERRDARR